MKLMMISGDRSILAGKKGAFWYTLEEMSKHWDRIDVICPRRSSNQLTSNQQPFTNVFFHPSPWNPLRQPWWILQKGSELIAEHHHDVMTVHEYPPFYNGRGAMWLQRSTGVPFVLEVHHVVGYPKAASVTEWIGYQLSRFMLPREARHAAAVRCVSQEGNKVLQGFGIAPDKLHIISSFYLDHALLTPDHSIAKTHDVVCAARLVENKGLRELLIAIEKIPSVRLLLIGDGPLRQKLEGQATSLGIADRVTFTGWLPSQEDVAKAMQRGKIFVMNSQSEGGPRSSLEAMALGLPVLSTHVGIMQEVIEDGKNGMFTTGEAEDLAGKIQKLLSDESLRTNLGQEAQRILDRFERKKLIEEYANFLKQACLP